VSVLVGHLHVPIAPVLFMPFASMALTAHVSIAHAVVHVSIAHVVVHVPLRRRATV
jgi:hypothetical protein